MQIYFSRQKPHYRNFLPLLFSPCGSPKQLGVLFQSSQRWFRPAFECRFTFHGRKLIMPLFDVSHLALAAYQLHQLLTLEKLGGQLYQSLWVHTLVASIISILQTCNTWRDQSCQSFNTWETWGTNYTNHCGSTLLLCQSYQTFVTPYLPDWRKTNH